MRKRCFILLLGGLIMTPTTMLASIDDGDNPDDYPGVWRSPAKHSHVYISYDEVSGIASVNFTSTINIAEIVVYLNGTEIDNLVVEAVEGTQIPLYLPVYGCGEINIQVKSGSILLASRSINL